MGRALVAERDVRLVGEPLAAAPGSAAICRCPASPTSSTTWPSPRLGLRASAQAGAPSSWSRPTMRHERGPTQRPRSGSRLRARPRPRSAATGSAKPLSRMRPKLGAARTARPSSRRVASAITTLPGAGQRLQPRRQVRRLADHRLLAGRAFADEIADHDHDRWRCRPAPPSGSPAGVASWPTALAIASPARTARSASSSCARGQPK